jgi:hypothetical protein
VVRLPFALGGTLPDMTSKWEHLTIDQCEGESWQGNDPQVSLDAMLNSQGSGGWELVAVVPLPESGCFRYVFKQPAK